jgi:pyruvate formate lyase activating enzyme
MRSTRVRLADIEPFSCVDGPGNRFVVFTQGCPFDCLACHNPETIAPGGARTAAVGELLTQIRLAEPYLAGVTVSGGEATSQWRFVRELFSALRTDRRLRRLTTYVDTNGHALPRVWDELLPVTDGFMVDLKALDPEVHRHLTGRDNALVLDSIRYLHAHDRLAEVRLLLVPGFNDTPEQLDRTAAWLAGIDQQMRVVVIGFRPHGVRTEWSHLPAAGPDVLDRARAALDEAGLQQIVTV